MNIINGYTRNHITESYNVSIGVYTPDIGVAVQGSTQVAVLTDM
jgi:hypothetical protein